MTPEEIDKRRELASFVRKGVNVMAVLKAEKVVDFVRYKRNHDAVKKLKERLIEGKGNA